MSIKRLLKTKRCQRFLLYLKEITDSRQKWKIKHEQYSLLFIIILAMMAGCNKFKEFYAFGCKYKNKLSKIIDLRNGIPSHDTMERAMHRIDTREFNGLVYKFVNEYIPNQYIHVCIDGKFVRSTKEGKEHNDAVDIVSAYIAGIKLSIYSTQVKTNQQNKNEATAIKQLLQELYTYFKNRHLVITIDAIAATNPILSTIVQYNWDYIICIKSRVKEKNWGLYEQIVDEFNAYDSLPYYQTNFNKNGRNECRKYSIIHDLSTIDSIKKWNTVKAIGMVESNVTNKKTGLMNCSKRYFLLSRHFSNQSFATFQRQHWEIESFHYVLDNTFNEDRMRMKKDSSTLNTNLLRKFVMNIISLHLSNKPYSFITTFRDSCKLLLSSHELLYIILHPLKSPKKSVY